MAKMFVPKKYLEEKIDESNCGHELVTQSILIEGETSYLNYHCVICDKDIKIDHDEMFANDRCVYVINPHDNYSVSFFKNMLTYLCYRYKDEKSIDLVNFFSQYQNQISDIVGYINRPTNKDKSKVRKKYQDIFKD